MAGLYERPMVHTRRFFVDVGTECTPDWVEVSAGVTAVKSSAESSREKAFMLHPQKGVRLQPRYMHITRSFTGMRVAGDALQEAALFNKVNELDCCEIEYVEFYEGLPEDMCRRSGNGWKGRAVLLCANDGSTASGEREALVITLAVCGEPKRGTVHYDAGCGVPYFEPLWQE